MGSAWRKGGCAYIFAFTNVQVWCKNNQLFIECTWINAFESKDERMVSHMISFLFFCSRKMSSKATLALLIYGIMMHYSVNCTPAGLSFPSVRYVHFYLSMESYLSRCWCVLEGKTNALLRHAGRRRLKTTSSAQLGIIAWWISG